VVNVFLFSYEEDITWSIYKSTPEQRPPNLLVAVLAPLVESLVEFLGHMSNFLAFSIQGACSTLGRLTLGTMTLCNALGASFGGFFGSPPGWYLYLLSR